MGDRVGRRDQFGRHFICGYVRIRCNPCDPWAFIGKTVSDHPHIDLRALVKLFGDPGFTARAFAGHRSVPGPHERFRSDADIDKRTIDARIDAPDARAIDRVDQAGVRHPMMHHVPDRAVAHQRPAHFARAGFNQDDRRAHAAPR